MNAVFERDFTAVSISPRFLWLRFAFASAMGLMLLIHALGAAASGVSGNVGLEVFRKAVWLGFALLVVTIPGSFATVLVHARAGSTLPVLLTTPLSPLAIAAGAFLARTAIFLVLVVATWPPLAMSLLYGGVRGTQLFAATASIAAAGLAVAAPAYVASAFARRTSFAVVTAYLSATAVLVGLWVAAEYAAPAGVLASALSPIHAAQESMLVGVTAADSLGPYVLLCVAAAASALSVAIVAWRIAREGRGTAENSRIAAVGRRTCRALRHENPILDREMRSAGLLRRGASGRGLMLLLIATEAVFLVLANTTNEWTSLPLHFGVLAMEMTLIVLAVTAAGATALAAEREGRTLELVRVTPLTPREIVIGKLSGILRGIAPCLAVPLFHIVLGWQLEVFSWPAVLLCLVTGSVALTAWAVFALSQALDQANPSQAVVRTMSAFGIVGVLVAANVGIPVYSVFKDIDPWVRGGVAFGANPVALTLLPAAGLRDHGSDATHLVVPDLSHADHFFAALCGVVWIALYAGFAWAVYRRLFETYRSRVDG
jgi:hypothetical protein